MKVLHVIPAVAPRYGGPSTVIWSMTAALARLGIKIEIATTDADGPDRRLTLADLPDGCVPIHMNTGVAALGRWLGDHVRHYDLVHTHSLWNRPVAAACAAVRCAGIPYVVRPCGMLSQYSWRRRWWKKYAYWWAVERRNVRGAAALHTTSPGERRDTLQCGVAAPVYDIPLGVDATAFETPPCPDWLRQRCGPTAGSRPILLFLSRLHPKKGVTDLLLPAFAALSSDVFLAIAGSADHSAPGYESEVRHTIRHLGLADRVAMIGPVSPSDRWAAYDGASIFVLPSYSENFGIVVAEAMARNTPVVISREVNAWEHVEAAGAGHVVPLNIEAIARKLEFFLADRVAREEAGARGRDYVRVNLCWNRIATRIVDVYRDCLA